MRKIKVLFFAVFLVFILGVRVNKNKIDDNLIVVDAMADSERELKAVWMSTFIGEAPYYSEAQFKADMTEALNIFDYYGINAVIYHVRTHNNAFYRSNLNPLCSWWSGVNFDVFDPLGWLIAECHKRGIEFHAWMNPYRYSTSFQSGTLPAANPQSDPNNLLEGKILNPAKEVVRQHIYDTIIEFAELYPNVDAIHFDDYFYVSTTAAPTGADERRAEVDKLIQGIHNVLTEFNQTNGTSIQFGISPTGIYKNGNGVVTYDANGNPITTGSSTRGFQHYGDYLYADTLKWAINGWIDYLMPQTYWARNHAAASYTKLLDWWDKAFRYLDCNLYSGIGVYMADTSGTYDWYNNMQEMNAQLALVEGKEHVKGYSIYSYKHLKNGYTGSTANSGVQIRNAYNTAARRAIKVPPEVRTMTPKVPLGVQSTHSAGTITWNGVSNAKFYYIFGSSSELTYSSNEIIGVVGHQDGANSFDIAGYNSNYYYGVRALSPTNHLGPIADPAPDNPVTVTFSLGYIGAPAATTVTISEGSVVSEPTQPAREGYNFLGWYFGSSLYDFNSPVYTDITLVAQWEEIIVYNITYNLNGGTLTVNYEDRDEMITDFLTDFYNYLSLKGIITPDDELTDFMHGYGYTSGYGGWYDDEYYFSHLYEMNNKEVNASTGKFINQPEYNKWVPLLDLMEEYTSTGNPNQAGQFWGMPDVVGIVRIKPFIQQRNLWTYLGPTETALITEILNRIPEGVFKELETLVYTYTYESPDITLPTPYREGCNFLGWYDNADFIGSPVTFIPSGSTGDKVFYARFDTPLGTYKVGYSLGYDGLVLPDQYVTEGEFATAPAEPTRTGYTFAGWYLGSSLYNFNTPVTANITLVAHWDEIAVYNIIYNLNGGILTSGYATRDEMIVDFLTDFHGFLQDEGVLTLDDTLLDFMHGYGYTSGYGGYYDDDTIIKYLYVKDNKAIDASTGKFINQPEYNKWVPLLDLMDDYTYVGYPPQTFWGSTYVGARRIKPFFQQINLWEEDGEPKASQIMAILNTIPEELEVDPVVSTFMSTSPDVTLPIPHRDGYDFAGWYTNESLEGSPITVIPTGTTNHVTVYAKWTTDNLSHLISTLDGASIRTEGIQGLRFYGEVDSSVKNNEHGFYLVYGSITKLELQNIADNNLTTHNGKQVYKVVVPGVTLTNQFSVVLIGIPIKGYIDGITVTAYVKVDGEVVLSDPITRCVAEVAVKAHENGEPVNGIITDIKNNIFDYTVEGNSLNIEPGYIYETDYTNLKEKFFVDWNNKFGTSLNNPSGSEFWASAKVGTPNNSGGNNYNLSQLNIYKFFNDPVYKDKWDWMLDFFLYVDITIHTSRQIYAIRGDGTDGSDKMYNANHLSYSIINFFNAAHQTGGYTAINFTSASMYDTLPNYSNVIIRKNLNVYDYFMRNSMIILPAINKTPPSGYTYKYYDGTNYYNAGDNYLVIGEKTLDIVLVANP